MSISVIDACDKTELAEVVANCNTFTEILRHFGLVIAGANVETLKRRLRYDDIDFSHIPCGINANRGRRLFVDVSLTQDEVLTADSKYSRKTAKRCILRNKIIEYKCVICGQPPEWNGKKLTLTLDHINGINNDHRISNLRFLCPNCNSQTDTFGSRNIKAKCTKCGKRITRRSKSGLCISCIPHKISNKIPDRLELETVVWLKPTTIIAVEYGVSSTTIAEWCKKYGISKPGPGYWRKLASKS